MKLEAPLNAGDQREPAGYGSLMMQCRQGLLIQGNDGMDSDATPGFGIAARSPLLVGKRLE